MVKANPSLKIPNVKKIKMTKKKVLLKPKEVHSMRTAWIHFLIEFRTKNGSNLEFGQISEAASQKWRTMDVVAKTPYEKLKQMDVKRREKELGALTPEERKYRTTYLRKRRRARRDTDRPKPPMRNFILFSREHRPKVVARYPNMDFKEIGKKMGELWGALSDVDKQPYNDQFKRDQEQHKKQLAAYKKAKLDAKKVKNTQ